jgi:F-box-like
MTNEQKFPNELLVLVFQHLTKRDLLNCTYTCWTWNSIGNEQLYYKVYGNSNDKFRKLIRTITGTPSQTGVNIANVMPRQLGKLIKVIKLQRDYYFHANSRWYAELLSTLATVTPNVHTADIYGPNISPSVETSTGFDWEASLSSKWPHLRRLRIAAGKPTGDLRFRAYNMETLLNRLHYLDIVYWPDFPEYLPPSPLMLSNIMMLKVAVQDKSSYDRLKEVLKSCQDTLHTLTLSWSASTGSLSVDDLITGLRQLKTIGFSYSISADFAISSFGDHVEHLELIGSHRLVENEVDREITNATLKTSSLKTLRVARCEHFVDYLAEILVANASTLQSLYFTGDSGDLLIERLIDNRAHLNNVTTLSFECGMLDDLKAKDLADIFPNVQFLEMTAGPFSSVDRWIASKTLGRFHKLKSIGSITFRELLEPNAYTLGFCDMDRTLFLADVSEV